MKFAAPLERLIERLRKLPGVGAKSAQRIAFHVLRSPADDARALSALLEVKEALRLCSICFNVTDTDPCLICADGARDRTAICVVEEAHNLVAIEKSGQFHGLYHVLHGSISPLRGIGPDDLKVGALLTRLRDGIAQEIILATNPNVEGESTAVYLSRLLKPLGLRVTRIGMGLAVGSELEYADEVTVGKALEGRREI